MGLDNGFILKNKETGEEKEVVYWRKHYDYRHVVLHAIGAYTTSLDKYEFDILPENIDVIIEELKPFLDKKYWEMNHSTIWDFEPDFLKKDIKNLKKVKKMIEKNPKKYRFYFYDSY